MVNKTFNKRSWQHHTRKSS